MDELKPCPFCGGEAEISSHCFGHGSYSTAVKCTTCGVEMADYHDSIEAWNRRIND